MRNAVEESDALRVKSSNYGNAREIIGPIRFAHHSGIRLQRLDASSYLGFE